jgi:PAS domain S-box-containing protein
MPNNGINKGLRVLILEDVPTDAELVENELRSGGFEFVSTRVADQDSFREGLHRFSPGIILADYSLPGFDGASALAIAREEAPQVPFIFVTGAVGEDRAVDLLKSGATDFVLKDRLSRLPLCVKRALEEVKEKRRRERAEEECARLAVAVEQASESIIMAGLKGTIQYVNRSFEALNGCRREEVLGKTYFDFLPDEPRGREIRETIDQGKHWHGRLVRKRKGGGTSELDVAISTVRDHSGKILSYLITERDVTREARLEQHMRKAQKMEALGTLAGGIAHDFNNMLATIVINTEMALLDLEEKSPARTSLPLVLKAASQGRELVKQIIAFSRQKEMELKPVKVSPILKENLSFLRSSLPTSIEIREDIVPGSDVILADPSNLHQIVLNLCTNAAHAMREQGGVLEVKLNPVEVDSAMAANHPDLKPGPYLRLTVSDTGHGMSPQVMERIFDPFFTTKKPGEGSGMGMAVVHGIVQKYGGAITVYSEVGQGSTFNVFFPRIEGEPEPARIPSPALSTGKGRILLVDDEEIQLRTMQSMLKRLGYQVTARSSSPEALSEFQADPSGFDLVITDQTMPKMTGAKLAESFLKIRPGIPVILCTGFSEVVNGEKAKLLGICELVMKPFTVKEISEMIRRVLEEKRGPEKGNLVPSSG